MFGIFEMESNPKRGIAIAIEATKKIKKQVKITNRENMSCGKGFIPLNAVKAILIYLFSDKDKFSWENLSNAKIELFIFLGNCKTGL